MSKILIAYYSLFQNTKRFAEEIANQTGGTLKEIIPENKYSFDYNTAAKEVRNQISRDFCPKLMLPDDFAEGYDTIFIGSPNWFKTMAPPVKSFLRRYDFANKKIILFCTHGGGGFGQMIEDIAAECPDSLLLEGLALGGGTVNAGEIQKWLEQIDIGID